MSFEDGMLDSRRWADLSHADQDKALPFLYRAVAYAHRANTDGVVPRTKFGEVFGEKLVAKLAQKRGWVLCWEIGVFEEDARGLFVHDYLDYQNSRNDRETGSQTAKTLNELRWADHPVTDSDAGSDHGSRNGLAAASDNGSVSSRGRGRGEGDKPLSPLVENLARRQRKPRGLTADEIRQMASTHTHQEQTHP